MSDKKRGVLRKVGGAINPLSPFFSMKRTVESGWNTIKDLDADMKERRKNPRIRTFREAMALRPRGAVSVRQIELSCLYNRRVALAFAFLAVVYSVSSIVAGSFFGALTGFLFTVLCALKALQYAHRSWQIERGKANPSAPLGSLQDFWRSKGSLLYTLNPRLFD